MLLISQSFNTGFCTGFQSTAVNKKHKINFWKYLNLCSLKSRFNASATLIANDTEYVDWPRMLNYWSHDHVGMEF